MPNIFLNGVNLYYEIHGEGAPLMLIAGLASDSQSWQPILNDLSRSYRVIIFDNRGAGRTTPQSVETSIQHIADDCMALVNFLGLPSVALLGHSMGGFVALDCAIRYPEYVSSLILAATSACNSERNNALFLDWVYYLESGMELEYWFRNVFYWLFSERFFKDKEALNNAVLLAIEYPYPQSISAFKKQVNALKESNFLERLPDVKSKTLIICGKEDLMFPPEESRTLFNAIPGSIFSVIEHAAHALSLENPRAFTHGILNFLDTLQS